MINRVYNTLFRNVSAITKTALMVGLFTLSAQLLGLVRDRLFAGQVGAGQELDLYYMAFKIPDFLYVSIATLASLTVLLPELTKHYGTGDDIGRLKAKQFVNQVFTVLMLVLVICSVVLFIIMPLLVPLLAPAFSQTDQQTLVWLSRMMLIQPILIGISNMFGSITQLFRKFWITSLSPVVYNLGIIIGIVLLYPTYGLSGLVWGVIIGAVLHLGIQLPFLSYKNMLPNITRTIDWGPLYRLAKISIPRTIGLSINSFTTLVIASFASMSGVGAVSLLTLANNIFNVPVNIIGTSLGTVSFPTLVSLFQQGNHTESVRIINRMLRNIILVSILAIIGVYVLKYWIIQLLLGFGTLSSEHLRTLVWVLMIFMFGLAAQASVTVLVRSWYAIGETRKPLLINIVSQVSIIVVIVVGFYYVRNTAVTSSLETLLSMNNSQILLLVLPLAVTIGNTINAIWLYRAYMNRVQRLMQG